MIKKVESIKYNYFFFLSVLLLMSALVSHILKNEDEARLDYRAYPSIIIFGVLVYLSKRTFSTYIIIVIFLSYSIFSNVGSLSANAGYMLDYCLTCIALLILPKIRFENFTVEKIDKSIFILCYGIILIYLLTLGIDDNMQFGRIYLVGFIIPHAFSYMMAIFVYYFLKRDKINYAIIPFLFGSVTGTRTGLFLCLLSVIAVMFSKVRRKQILRYSFYFLLFIPSLNYLSSQYSVLNSQIESVSNSLSDFRFSTSENDQKSIDFSSNRSLLLAIGIDDITKEFLSIQNLIGRGPRESNKFIERNIGVGLWFHNDFIEILFSLGLINLIFYIYAIIKYYLYTKNIYFLIFILFSAFTNGFFFYYSFVIIVVNYLSIYLDIHENPSN